MEVRASAAALEFVGERGGKLFIWSKSARCCCGGTRFLEAATTADERRSFRRLEAEGIELYADLQTLPALLEIELHGRFHRTVRVYWNGCA